MKTTTYRAKRPEQDYLEVVYEYDGFFVTADASWYASPYPFRATYRFQFENALVAYENGKLTVYERDGGIKDLSEIAEDSGVLGLPKSDAYANEIRYFADCVINNKEIEKVTENQLCDVIGLLRSL